MRANLSLLIIYAFKEIQMFKLYNKHEIMIQFALQFVRTTSGFEQTGDQYTLPNLGLCETYSLPIRYLADNRQDEIIGFIPVGFDWCSEPLYYAFSSEMDD